MIDHTNPGIKSGSFFGQKETGIISNRLKSIQSYEKKVTINQEI